MIQIKTIFVLFCLYAMSIFQVSSQDKIKQINAPYTVDQGQSITISVNYNSNANRDLYLIFEQDHSPWKKYVTIKKDVGKGSGTVAFKFNIPDNTPIADNEYQFNAFLTTDGDGWGQKVANKSIKDINVNASTHNSEPSINIILPPSKICTDENIIVEVKTANSHSDIAQIEINGIIDPNPPFEFNLGKFAKGTHTLLATATYHKGNEIKSTKNLYVSECAGFEHPGILSTTDDLKFIKSKIDTRKEPWYSAFNSLKRGGYASLNYKAKPRSEVICGRDHKKDYFGCSEFESDSKAIYSQALVWALTGDKRYANNALKILRSWTNVFNSARGYHVRLVFGGSVPMFANAAELLKYTDSGWNRDDDRKTDQFFRKLLPIAKDDKCPCNNWVTTRVEAHLAIAVFLDDRNEFNNAIKRWRYWLPRYIYLKSDGSNPIGYPGPKNAEEIMKLWRGGAKDIVLVDGISNETCRDLVHMQMGFGTLIYGAQTAWIQGVDLFKEGANRIVPFMELHAPWLINNKVPSWVCPGKDVLVGEIRAWEIAYSQYNQRLGYTLNNTAKMNEKGRPTNYRRLIWKPETITHAYIFNDDRLLSNSITIDNDIRDEMFIYPNPSSGLFQFTKSSEWEVYSCTGQMIQKGESDQINLIGKPKGLYFVKIDKNLKKLIIN